MDSDALHSAVLPSAPLEFASPLTVSGPGLSGRAVLDEVPPEHAPLVFRALRLLLAWARGPEACAALFAPATLDAWATDVHAHECEDALRDSLTSIAAELSRPAEADPERLALACMALCEWALDGGFDGTALALAEASALVWPDNPRYAWAVAMLYRRRGRTHEAEQWFRRTSRVAVWNRDWSLHVLVLHCLGNAYEEQGKPGEAIRLLESALKLARRYRFREREAKVCHDLFVVTIRSGNAETAERWARRAWEGYGPGHPNLPRLAHDLAHLWSDQGHFARSLPVLLALLSHFERPDLRLQALASATRAAGACGQHEIFEQLWPQAWHLAQDLQEHPVTSAALVELGLGASSLAKWQQAETVLTRGLSLAEQRNEFDAVARAEAALDHVRRHEKGDVARRTKPSGTADAFARDFARSLQEPIRTTDDSPELCSIRKPEP